MNDQAWQVPFASKFPSDPHKPGFVQMYPLAAVIAQVVPSTTVVAALAQFVPLQVWMPADIVGTVHRACGD